MSGANEVAALRWRISLVFFIQAFAAGSFLTRIPDIQTGLGVPESTLGIVLLGQPVGSLVFFFFASSVVERLGTRPVMLIGVPALALTVGLVSISPSPALVFVWLAVNGALFAFTGLAMNVEADRIEAATGARVLSLCHGIGSAGLLPVSTIGAAIRGLGIPPAVHLLVLVPVVAAVSLLVLLPLAPSPPRPFSRTGRRPRLVLPSGMTMLLVGVMISGALLEGTSRTWSIIYMRDSFSIPEWLEAMALPAFLVCMSGGRLLGDGWAGRFGPTRTSRALLATAIAGVLLIALAPNVPAALCGFALLGLGASVIYPLSVSAAARLTDRPSSENVASMTLASTVILLGVPPAMGSIATHLGIRTVFAALLPVLVLSFVLARFLEPAGATASEEDRRR